MPLAQAATSVETHRLPVAVGDRIFSAFPIDPETPYAGFGENCLWVTTEADRSVTTILRAQRVLMVWGHHPQPGTGRRITWIAKRLPLHSHALTQGR